METVSSFFSRNGKTEKHAFTERLRGLGGDVETQCNMVLAMMVGATVELSQGASLGGAVYSVSDQR